MLFIVNSGKVALDVWVTGRKYNHLQLTCPLHRRKVPQLTLRAPNRLIGPLFYGSSIVIECYINQIYKKP